ncbi:hypothetical protein J1614_005242 [Plenodomus biglobosus]|nr:hypothetical protein J1614_005242 [Plenodomus biglobosus]
MTRVLQVLPAQGSFTCTKRRRARVCVLIYLATPSSVPSCPHHPPPTTHPTTTRRSESYTIALRTPLLRRSSAAFVSKSEPQGGTCASPPLEPIWRCLLTMN